MSPAKTDVPTFRPMVEACRDCGISRTKAYQLANSGQLETFKLGARRYVLLDSLRTLPERLKATKEHGAST